MVGLSRQAVGGRQGTTGIFYKEKRFKREREGKQKKNRRKLLAFSVTGVPCPPRIARVKVLLC